MSTAQRILERIKTLPADRQQEVLDFAEFLSHKSISERPPTEKGFHFKPMTLPGWPKDCLFRREDIYGDDGR